MFYRFFPLTQASLNLNPANMVPGKVPNKRSSTSESVTFDEQAEVKILENKTKVRYLNYFFVTQVVEFLKF